MKKKLITFISNARRIALQVLAGGGIIFFLDGCGCESYCGLFYSVLRIERTKESLSYNCSENCLTNDFSYSSLPKKKTSSDTAVANESLASTKSAPPADSAVIVGNPVPQKNAPGEIESPQTGIRNKNSDILPGEYFATTVFAGPTASFINSSGDYTVENTKYPAGIGFQFGVGNAFPINRHWGLTSSIRFKQTNGVEKLDYSVPGGGGSSEYETKYNYNYVGGNILAQYYLNPHLSITAGPELDYLVSATKKPGGGGEKQNIKQESTGFGFDLLAGIKYEIPAGNRRSKWGLSLVYDHRLSRLNKKDDSGNPSADYHMKSVHLGLSYFICGCGRK